MQYLIPMAFVVSVTIPIDATAQAEQPRIMIGGGISVATNDMAHRMQMPGSGDAGPQIFTIEGSARIARRVAIGAEFMRPAPAEAVTQARNSNTLGQQHEQALFATLRFRPAGRERVAIDLVAGAGVLFQHHEVQFAPCFAGCAVVSTGTLTNRAPAQVIGADVPIRLEPHFVVAFTGRWHFLHRGDHSLLSQPRVSQWPFEWRSSSRHGIGVSLRAVW